jgi:RimJ/RimL family protein N-acetyltransferase
MLTIRHIRESDAERFLALSSQLDQETAFRLLEAGERTTTVEEQRDIIRRFQCADNHALLVAEWDGRLVGYIAGIGGSYRRNRRTVEVVVAVLQAFWGRGIGTRLFEELEKWARQHGIHRLELTVMGHNETAIGLYRKMGFEVEGRRRDALFVDGEYVDEHAMAKLLTPPVPSASKAQE